MNNIIERARNNKTHASVPFWSWNDKLEEQELRRQIRRMKELGMGGFFMHARGGLETEYMSDEWFDCVRICIDEAKKQNMDAWAYDENGWPSGFAGGALLSNPANHVAYLTWETVQTYPNVENDILGVYHISENGATRVTCDDNCNQYTVIRRNKDFSYVDILNPSIAKQFISATHEVYKKELGDDFGATMPGFFTDEPQYYPSATPWSDIFLTAFSKRFGYDVLDALPALFFDFPGAREYRYDYHVFLSECFIQNYAKPVYEWCDKNGIKLTGHAVEEWGLTSQMAWCSGVMPFYQYQHIPGVDYLGRGIKSVMGTKQLSSVCEQLGKPVRLSEMFGCCGWNVSPLELKRIADLQFATGVNLICEHLYAYSERGQRKRDYPNHYSEHNPWQDHYKDFVTHYKHLGSILSEGCEQANVLVIHPMHSAYLDYKHNDYSTISDLNAKFVKLTTLLSNDQIPFHYGDETILRDIATVDGTSVRVGNCKYDYVILPHCYTLDHSTVTLLKAYIENGGKLYIWGGRPDRIDGRVADLSFLRSNISYEEIKNDADVNVRIADSGVPLILYTRVTNKGRIFFLANPSEKSYPNVRITVRKCKGLTLVDPITLQRNVLRGERNSDGSITVMYDFGDSASCLLFEEESSYEPLVERGIRPTLKPSEKIEFAEEPENIFVLYEAEVSKNGESFSKTRPIEQIRDNLLREHFQGNITLRYSFIAETTPDKLILVAEPIPYKLVTINGIEICLTTEYSRFDRNFVGADIAKYTRTGLNTVEVTFPYFQKDEVYKVLYGPGGEALRNRLAFDTEIENIYLYGNFGVRAEGGYKKTDTPDTYRGKGPFVLTAQSDAIDCEDIVKSGYPFFAGKMRLRTALHYQDGDPTQLKLSGDFAVSKVFVNGNLVESNIFTRNFELSPYLLGGVNALELEIYFSNRNLLGPHHCVDPEPTVVSPNSLSFENAWSEDRCEIFVDDLAFVKFGIIFQ